MGQKVHTMKFDYIEEIAPLTKEQEDTPLTEEQWNWFINYACMRYGQQGAQAVIEMRRFQDSLDELHRMAGHSQEHIGEVSQALLDMAGIEGNHD